MHTVPAMYSDYTRHSTGAAYTVPDLEPAPKPRFCAPAEDPEPLEIVVAHPQHANGFVVVRYRRVSPDDWELSYLREHLGWGPAEPIRHTDANIARVVAGARRDCVLSPAVSTDGIIRRIFTP